MVRINELPEPQPPFIVYVDVDGVLADFDAKVEEYVPHFGNQWHLLPDNFFALLDKMQGADQLMSYIKQNFAPRIYALTAAPKPHKGPVAGRAAEDKTKWLMKHFHFPENHVKVVYREEKQNYATPHSILIDDWPPNIREWREKGGIGILYTDVDSAIDELEQIISDKQ